MWKCSASTHPERRRRTRFCGVGHQALNAINWGEMEEDRAIVTLACLLLCVWHAMGQFTHGRQPQTSLPFLHSTAQSTTTQYVYIALHSSLPFRLQIQSTTTQQTQCSFNHAHSWPPSAPHTSNCRRRSALRVRRQYSTTLPGQVMSDAGLALSFPPFPPPPSPPFSAAVM